METWTTRVKMKVYLALECPETSREMLKTRMMQSIIQVQLLLALRILKIPSLEAQRKERAAISSKSWQQRSQRKRTKRKAQASSPRSLNLMLNHVRNSTLRHHLLALQMFSWLARLNLRLKRKNSRNSEDHRLYTNS